MLAATAFPIARTVDYGKRLSVYSDEDDDHHAEDDDAWSTLSPAVDKTGVDQGRDTILPLNSNPK